MQSSSCISFLAKITVFCCFCLLFACQNQQKPNQKLTDYQADRDLGALFEQVQTTGVFEDYKTFVDCNPKKNPSEIIEAYDAQKSNEGFVLKDFVLAHFDLPPALEKKTIDKKTEMIPHLKNHWVYLTRTAQSDADYTTMISLPHPYIVPGGRFREMFYWDSYFSMIGLLESDEDALALGMLRNFAFMIDAYGFVPNGNRTYFASRSQPPFFAEMLVLYAKKHGIDNIMEFLPALEKEYQFWMKDTQTAQKSGQAMGRSVPLGTAVLNRYNGTLTTPRAEGYGKEKRWASALPKAERATYHKHLRAVCESGWDFSSRWFADGKTKITTHCEDIVPVCLNSLLFGMEKQLAVMYQHYGNTEQSSYYNTQAKARQAAMLSYLWSAEKGHFVDYDFVKKEHTSVLSLATLYPLYFGLATDEQAASVAKIVQKQLLFAGGVVTTTVHTGEQWDFPNGWAPLQWMTVMGLAKYEHQELATMIAKRWLSLNEKVFRDEGKMMEKYNVVDTTLEGGGGGYKNQDGFGWTNGVALGLDAFLKGKNQYR